MVRTRMVFVLTGLMMIGNAVADAAPGDLIRKIVNEDANDGSDSFGVAVCVAGNTCVVGAAGLETAFIFDVSTGQRLFTLGGDANNFDVFQFGISVAMSDDVVIVGARYDDEQEIHGGAAFLFDVRTGARLHKLLPKDPIRGGNFGNSVAISGNRAVVGSPQEINSDEYARAAYLFDVNSGEQIAKLVPSDGEKDDQFGNSVGISGNIVAVGSPYNGTSGAVYLFQASTGKQIAKLLPTSSKPAAEFGWDVAISGDTIVIGAPSDDEFAVDGGAAHFFDVETGKEYAKVVGDDTDGSDHFGKSVAIDDRIAIIGAYTQDGGVGAAYLFDAHTAEQSLKLVPHDGDGKSEIFGFSVGISGTTVITGSPSDTLPEEHNTFGSGSSSLFDAAIDVCEGDSCRPPFLAGPNTNGNDNSNGNNNGGTNPPAAGLCGPASGMVELAMMMMAVAAFSRRKR